MGSTARKIIGSLVAVAGIGFIVWTFFSVWWLLFYGIPLVIIGIVIFFNKGEDEIEERKDLNKSEGKKS